MFIDSLHQMFRVAVAVSAAYAALVLLLRFSGNRTLAKLSAFDLVVTVALGSALATIGLSSDVAIAEGITAFVALVLLQFLVARLSSRAVSARRALKSEPVVVVRDGQLLFRALRAERLSRDEIQQAIRATGVGGLELVAAVVLETDGTLSVITHEKLGSASTLPDSASLPASRE